MSSRIIIDFYRDEIGNTNGNRRQEILGWSDGALEMDHDYIQWLFPSNEASNFNCDAPTLTQEEAAIFQADPELQEKVRESFVRILKFFEFELSEDEHLVVKPKQEVPLWLRAFNHNMLRATRVIKSLRLLGLHREAAAFFKCLEGFKIRVSGNTFEYWRAAAIDPLW
jgi:hypothetical protein